MEEESVKLSPAWTALNRTWVHQEKRRALTFALTSLMSLLILSVRYYLHLVRFVILHIYAFQVSILNLGIVKWVLYRVIFSHVIRILLSLLLKKIQVGP